MDGRMRIFFMGATKFGLRCLRAAIECNQTIVGCTSTPPVFKISYAPEGVKNVNYVDLVEVAKELGVPCIPYDRKNVLGFASEVAKLRPDVLLVAGWYYMVPSSLRSVAPLGAIGLHGSLLPKYRGGAPLVWAIMNGEREAGLTLFHLEDVADAGDIIGQEKFPIGPDDTIADALARTDQAAERLLKRYLPLLAENRAPRIPQNHADATKFPQRKPEDGQIDWSKSPEETRNFIRAQTRPYPGAFTYIQGKKVTIWDATIE